ncbi:glycosyl hydrolase family 28 protein [Maribellus comscasis]|nr:glycosyl hydrolase family 28 protein [Maribellus comscasis]
MKKFYVLGMLGLIFCSQLSCVHQQPSVPISRSGVEKSVLYEVNINNQEVFVAHEECFADTIFETAICELAERTQINISFNNIISKYRIRPDSKDIKGEVDGNELSFEITKPQMLVIEINNAPPLLLSLLPIEEDIPKPDDPNVMYFGSGIHDAGLITPKSGQTIYLASGALVKGRIYGEDLENVKVKGRGILDARGYTSKQEKICAIEFRKCNDITVEGIGLRAGEWWQTLYLLCNNIEVSWMHLLSFGVNNDGIDIDGVTNFYAHDCFIGCGDDGFGWHALDAETNGEPPTQNCLAENCVIYNTHAGNGLRIGASMETSLFKDITFRNIDVLEHVHAGIRSDHSDWALCENITFENFFLEKPGRPIEVKVEKTRYSNTTGFRDERGAIKNWNFINVQSPGGKIELAGFDKLHPVNQILFKNCCIGGSPLGESSIVKNEFVFNVCIENDQSTCFVY